MGISIADRWVQVDDLRIHCLEAGGAGEALLLLHGGGLDSASLSWRPALTLLGERHRVIAPDLPGYETRDGTPMQVTMQYYTSLCPRDGRGLERAVVGDSLWAAPLPGCGAELAGGSTHPG